MEQYKVCKHCGAAFPMTYLHTCSQGIAAEKIKAKNLNYVKWKEVSVAKKNKAKGPVLCRVCEAEVSLHDVVYGGHSCNPRCPRHGLPSMFTWEYVGSNSRKPRWQCPGNEKKAEGGSIKKHLWSALVPEGVGLPWAGNCKNTLFDAATGKLVKLSSDYTHFVVVE